MMEVPMRNKIGIWANRMKRKENRIFLNELRDFES